MMCDAGVCGELLKPDLTACRQPAYLVELDHSLDGHALAPLGRPVSCAARCDDHGGATRAREVAGASWDVLAPASVGDYEAVIDAGTMALDSRAVYVVVRREADQRVPAMWRIRLTRVQVDQARRGLGLPQGTHRHDRRLLAVAPGVADLASADAAAERLEHLQALGVEDAVVETLPARIRSRARPWVASLGVGSFTTHLGAYHTSEEAEEAGRAAWRAHVDQAVAAITRARGGTLSWGLPVVPRQSPEILRPAPGQSAWDAMPTPPEIVTRLSAEFLNGVQEDVLGAILDPERPHSVNG